jgi:hypothetical protein
MYRQLLSDLYFRDILRRGGQEARRTVLVLTKLRWYSFAVSQENKVLSAVIHPHLVDEAPDLRHSMLAIGSVILKPRSVFGTDGAADTNIVANSFLW